MTEFLRLVIGVLILLLGIPIGNWLAKITKEELNESQKWFKLIIIISLIVGFIGLIIGNDVILFSFFFIAIVASRSLMKSKSTKKGR